MDRGPPLRAIVKPSTDLKILRQLFGLDRTRILALGSLMFPYFDPNVVLIIIYPYLHSTTRGHRQRDLGVSVLNLRYLQLHIDSNGTANDNIIQSYEFQFTRQHVIDDFFHFGDVELVINKKTAEEMMWKINDLIRDRPYVLISFDNCGREIVLQRSRRRPVYCLNLFSLARQVLPLPYHFSLGQLCDWLGVPSMDRKSAGNCSRFAMHAVLRLAAKDWQLRIQNKQITPTPEMRQTISSLGAITRAWKLPSREVDYSLKLLFEDAFEEPDEPQDMYEMVMIRGRPIARRPKLR
ncbi:hypothetical protein F5Y03DRAFT_405321 [Xylaria venustula]|nr:hypothetical protein F5Y03DRAFT_405321 [Xylaria venustula]